MLLFSPYPAAAVTKGGDRIIIGEEQAKLFCIIVAVSVMRIIVSQVIDFQKFMSTLKKVMILLYIYVLT